MLSQHFLITLNRRYVIDHQIVINLNCEAFRFDITDKGRKYLSFYKNGFVISL